MRPTLMAMATWMYFRLLEMTTKSPGMRMSDQRSASCKYSGPLTMLKIGGAMKLHVIGHFLLVSIALDERVSLPYKENALATFIASCTSSSK